MSETISATYEYLLTRYRPLLTLKHATEVMHPLRNEVRTTSVLFRVLLRGKEGKVCVTSQKVRAPEGSGGFLRDRLPRG